MTEYNEIFGWMPAHLIKQLSPEFKLRVLAEWIHTKPTDAGYFILRLVLESLGDEFFCYLIKGVIESMEADDQPVSKETVINEMEDLLNYLATDANVLMGYVSTFCEETDRSVNNYTFNKPQPAVAERKRDPVTGRFVK